MKLRELNACFEICVAITSAERDAEGMYVWRDANGEPEFWSPTPERYVYQQTDDIAKAHGLWFDCPACAKTNGHGVLIGFAGRNAPHPLSVGKDGQPTNWNVSGTGLDDLVLTPSIQLHGGCNWHGFVGSNGVPPGEAA
jgi:hypothetical protein